MGAAILNLSEHAINPTNKAINYACRNAVDNDDHTSDWDILDPCQEHGGDATQGFGTPQQHLTPRICQR